MFYIPPDIAKNQYFLTVLFEKILLRLGQILDDSVGSWE